MQTLITKRDLQKVFAENYDLFSNLDEIMNDSYNDVLEMIQYDWWEKSTKRKVDQLFDQTKINPQSQLKKSIVYHCIVEYIIPLNSKNPGQGEDRENIKFYRESFEREYKLMLRRISYDFDDSGEIDQLTEVERSQPLVMDK